MPRRAFSGTSVSTTLSSDITSSATTIPVASVTGWPTGPNPAFGVLRSGSTEEKFTYTGISGTSLTGVTRAQDGTSAAAWSTGATVEHVWTATDAEDSNKHIFDTAQAETDHSTLHNATRHAAVSHTTTMIGDGQVTLPKLATAVLTALYPVGSVYINADVATNPATLMGFGTWVAFGAGRVMVGLDAAQTEFDTLGETGGAKTHTLSTAEIPSHDHAGVADNHNHPIQVSGTIANLAGGGGTQRVLQSDSGTFIDTDTDTYTPDVSATGGGGAHNNLQPYVVVYAWRRTA